MQLLDEQHVQCLIKNGCCSHNIAVTEELPARKIVTGATIIFQCYDPALRCSKYYRLQVRSVQAAEPKYRQVVLTPALEEYHLPAPG